MASSLSFSPLLSLKSTHKSGLISHNFLSRKVNWIIEVGQSSNSAAIKALIVKAAANKPNSEPTSLLCDDCEGKGCKKCSKCNGTGVNSVDYFNGQFKAGSSCWLCGGKKEILCGNCSGAGFLGGFMNNDV